MQHQGLCNVTRKTLSMPTLGYIYSNQADMEASVVELILGSYYSNGTFIGSYKQRILNARVTSSSDPFRCRKNVIPQYRSERGTR
jgi:vancomycin permeability regulator SanA